MVPRDRFPRPKVPKAPRRPHPAHGPSRSAVDDGETIQGLHAGLAVFTARRNDVLRVAFSRAVRREVEALVQWAASCGIPCREATDAELDRIAESSHHEGLCVLARPRRWLSTAELADTLTRAQGTCIALDRVRNPYNVGAIVRSAAFFGIDAALLGAPAPHPGLSPTAVRVAEGGIERLALARTTDLADTLGRLRARGVHVVGADGHADRDALVHRFERPAVLVLGHEREGLGDRIRAQCDAVVAIRGSGAVESLNVAVAAGVLVSRMMATASRREPSRP
jgi:TrmH RNA methyltransferase